ncbi:hypothetical protein COU54_01840 [Candidatus Pacearchaeota archaeon CG10_big_fil_rev_8_21_14_0_10_31_24]|nr:MAG: hypothetical protein COU54_01840 [Candidatus Pacearchaeota archaeon CG10_big_fil_rev_8_21_14_0_10_31_24]
MNKKTSFIISLLLTLSVYFSSSYFDNSTDRETILVSRVIDGDTIKSQDGRSLRLLNINSPEKNTPGSEKSTKFLKLLENQTIEIEVLGIDKYQRELVKIYTPEYLNLKIVELGFASKYLVQESELTNFAKAEESAIQNSQGIWIKSPFFDCITSEINEKEEFVQLHNSCEGINFKDWFLKDESRKVYKFKNTWNKEVIIYSIKGEDAEKEIYWNSETNIWNNDRDTLYLFDNEGKIVHYHIYGY